MYTLPTEKEYKRIKEYIDILVNYGFRNWEDDNGYWKWLSENEEELTKHYGFHFYDGCTKVVVVCDNFGWVIKVDIRLNDYAAPYTYCEQEALNWIAALEANLEDYFAATYFVDIINGVEFFMQEYAENDEDRYDSRCYNYYYSKPYNPGEDWEEQEDRIQTYGDYNECMDDEDRLVALYGSERETYRLINFCFSNAINDLHLGNFGNVLSDGRLVIFDYSGF